MIKVMLVFGTRPEAIKMLPIVKEVHENRRDEFQLLTVVTAQHRELLDQVLDYFQVVPDYDLNIMSASQTLEEITTKVMLQLSEVLEKEKPDVVLVHGDTTTCLAASLAAFYKQIPVGHVEAGLRTWDKFSPYPEEMNRQLTDVLADFYFAPTEQNKANLLEENRPEDAIYITGNTVIDALKYTVTSDYTNELLVKTNPNDKILLLTMHRRENQGTTMESMFRMIRQVVADNPDVRLVFPVHPNPKVKKLASEIFSDVERIHLIEPLGICDFHNIISRCYLVMTDSGGIQEEAPSLGTPVLLLRNETERPEGVSVGAVKLVGTEASVVQEEIQRLLDSPELRKEISEVKNPYGDGDASKRILDILQAAFQKA